MRDRAGDNTENDLSEKSFLTTILQTRLNNGMLFGMSLKHVNVPSLLSICSFVCDLELARLMLNTC